MFENGILLNYSPEVFGVLFWGFECSNNAHMVSQVPIPIPAKSSYAFPVVSTGKTGHGINIYGDLPSKARFNFHLSYSTFHLPADAGM